MSKCSRCGMEVYIGDRELHRDCDELGLIEDPEYYFSEEGKKDRREREMRRLERINQRRVDAAAWEASIKEQIKKHIEELRAKGMMR